MFGKAIWKMKLIRKIDRKWTVIAIGKLKRDKNRDGEIDRIKIRICIAIVGVVGDRDSKRKN